jgi:hypothetical protein
MKMYVKYRVSLSLCINLRMFLMCSVTAHKCGNVACALF